MKEKRNHITLQLKEATQGTHSKIEKLKFFGALFNKQLSQTNYIYQLKALAIVFSVLEHEITSIKHSTVKTILKSYPLKYLIIKKDLEFLNARALPDNLYVVSQSLDIADCILRRTASSPLSLLGYLYVLEGSMLGGKVLLSHYKDCFDLDDTQGLSFFSMYGDQASKNWNQFKNKMDEALFSMEEQQQIVDAAVECFEKFYELYQHLDPTLAQKKEFHVTSINPEAGNHSIPTDAREITAAIRASEICWKRYPYYQMRYGERGTRFGRSDCAWLASLVDMSQEGINRQIKWLIGLLATKGMPSLTMQTQLEILSAELTKDIPENQHKYEKLLKAAQKIEQERLLKIDQQTIEHLDTEFKESLGDAFEENLNDAGKLIIAAIVDEQMGFTDSFSNIKDWMVDSNRFSQKWIDAVHQLVQKVNKCMGLIS